MMMWSMKTRLSFLAAYLLLACHLSTFTDAACENLCSGHGNCLLDDVCECYDGWGLGINQLSGDCSERICPFDVAWVDTPDKLGNFHKHMECSGKGVCDRTIGECECFDGFVGQGCYRSACPNDCSGHGNCEFIEDIPFSGTWNEYSKSMLKVTENSLRFEYPQWDARKSMGCVCDAHYGDLDCSKRMCPYGTDVLDVNGDNLLVEQRAQTQTIQFIIPNSVEDGGSGISDEASYNGGRSFSVLFKSQLNETFQTVPIVFDNAVGVAATDLARDIQVALLSLPNRVIDGVKVTCLWDFTNAAQYDKLSCDIKFTGSSVQGKQHLLSVDANKCGDGCSPKTSGLWLNTLINVFPDPDSRAPGVFESVSSDLDSFECGRRGRCDYNTGVCHCFTGFTGVSCNIQTALV